MLDSFSIKEKNIRELNDDNLFYVYDLLKQINQVGQVNLVLSNGDVTIVYQDKDDFNPIYYKNSFLRQIVIISILAM